MSRKKEIRLEKIREILIEREKIRNIDLAKELGITVETLRHDLDYLEEQNIIIKEHGSSRINLSLKELPLMMRHIENTDDKRRIAYRAFQEIQNGQIIFLGAGSTVLSGIESLKYRKEITIVTNSLPVAMETAKLNHKVILIGGMIINSAYSTYGSDGIDMLKRIHMDLMITGSAGIEGSNGFTTNKFEEVGLRRQVLAQSRRSIVVCDNRKFHQKSAYTDLFFKEADLLITNQLTMEMQEVVKEIPKIIQV